MDGTTKRANKSKSSCCVPQCTVPGYVIEDGKKITFHSLPKNEKLLSEWIVKIKRDIGTKFIITKYTKICSRHFTNSDFSVTAKSKRVLKRNAIPSVFPWNKPTQFRRVLQRGVVEDRCIQMDVNVQTPEAENSVTKEQELTERNLQLEAELEVQKKAAEFFQKQRDQMKVIIQKQAKVKQEKNTFSLEQFRQSDADICFYTGFPTYNALMQCLYLLNPGENGENIVYCDSFKKDKKIRRPRKLKITNEYFLTLIRLRLGLFEKDLAHRFKISQSTVHKICTTWIDFMYLQLGNLNIWPTKKAIMDTMPESMKEKFPDLEWIIDAFEMQCCRPSSLMLQSQSYSNYKSRNTVKGLVACTPSGQLGFISQLYTGNISDRELTIRSGFLKMPHRNGAIWLVDKGFQIQDLADPLGVTVNMPAFVGQNSQMTANEVFLTQQIASERIHIERAINKVKKFHIFDRPIALSMLGTVNQMWTVCALLTLFQKPIISA